MTRTTPPRPHDLLALFPQLDAQARNAIRLHPRHGEPTAAESSVGGPLLWPSDEPWPVCGLEHEDLFDEPFPESVQGERVPEALIPVAQLYYRDVPGLPWPDRYDLLQVLWCPRDHPEGEAPYNPEFQVRRRTAGSVASPLAAAPVPLTCNENYVPERCVLHPEAITEYPHRDAQAPGWKALGHGGVWGIVDPFPVACDCGVLQLPLLTAGSGEFDGGTGSWQPVEEAGTGWEFADPVGVTIGRGYTLQLYYCPASEDHPNRAVMF
ncbi:hypothetical protein [Glycomyces sp. MUSA5-2]|uniref:hypothetical protein n=1 Tax=Glycomyces sp. MUSA5-2 TaxID=2053002 RepID=UPI003009AAD3